MSSCGGSNANMETSVASSMLLSSTPPHTSVRRCLKSFTSCTFVRYTRWSFMPQNFVVKWTMAVWQPQIWCMNARLHSALARDISSDTPEKDVLWCTMFATVTRLSRYLMCINDGSVQPSWHSVSTSTAAAYPQCVHSLACLCHAFGRCVMLLAEHSSNASKGKGRRFV